MRFRVYHETVELVLTADDLRDAKGDPAYGVHDWDNRRVVLSTHTPRGLRLNVLSHELWHCYRCDVSGTLDAEAECNLFALAFTALFQDVVDQGGVAALDRLFGDPDPDGPRLSPLTYAPQSAADQSHAEFVRRTKFADLSDDQWGLILADCRRYGVNPADAFIVWEADERTGELLPALRTTVLDVTRIARDTGLLEWEGNPQFCGPEGAWVDVWLRPEPPTLARCRVKRRDFAEPFEAVVEFKMCARYVQAGAGGYELTSAWLNGAATMLGKCALVAVLRKAFREFLGRIVTREESDPDGQPMRPAGPPTPGLRRAARRANPAGGYAAAAQYDDPRRAATWAEGDDTLPDNERGLLRLLMDRFEMGKAEAEAFAAAQRAVMPRTFGGGWAVFSAAVVRAAGKRRVAG